jgi:hypothetical protein
MVFAPHTPKVFQYFPANSLKSAKNWRNILNIFAAKINDECCYKECIAVMAELQHLPVERHDQPPEEGPAEGVPLVPGRVQRGIQQEQP